MFFFYKMCKRNFFLCRVERVIRRLMMIMDGGDLKTRHRQSGGDLKTLHRQSGGLLGLLKMFGLGSAGSVQQQMSAPSKEQMTMQRGGFPWALAGLSMLPMLMGRGQEDRIRNQMKTARDPIMQRGGLSVPPALMSSLPLLKQIGIPLAMGALASVGDNVVDKVFGKGRGGATARRKRATKTATKKPRMKKMRKSQPRKKVKTAAAAAAGGAKRYGRKAFQEVGRRLFEKGKKAAAANFRLESSPASRLSGETPFAQKLRESIRSTMSRSPSTSAAIDSSHIGQTFNI